MKFKADRATLLKALAHVQSVVEKRNTIPILANVMIAVRDSHLTLTATDMEIAIVEDVTATPARNGAATAPAATLYEIVRKLPEGAEVELDHAGGDAQFDAALRPLRHQPGRAADRRFPLDDRRHAAAPVRAAGPGAARPDRPHPLRHLAPRKPATTSTASTCTPPRATAPRCCAPSPPTATASPASRNRCRRAPAACPASSSRARPSPNCASCSTRSAARSRSPCPTRASSSASAPSR